MDSGIVDRVEDWDQDPFSDGFATLSALADREFSGAIRSGGTWLFVLNGRVVGASGGSVDDFEGVGGTAFQAPHPGLPLLFAMQERGGETRARYFTDETPLSEVHETLSSGNFTGYVELSENVHSGDYFIVYYGGRALSVAFVGGTGRLLTDDEAFEQAADEVGIFEVYDVDLDVEDLPESDESAEGVAVASVPDAADDQEPSDADGGTEDSGAPTSGEVAASDEGSAETEDSDSIDGASDGTVETSEDTSAEASTREGETADAAPSEAASERTDSNEEAETSDSTGHTESRESETADADRRSSGGSMDRPDHGVRTPPDVDPFSEEQAWRETRAVPALDPDESADPRSVDPEPAEPAPEESAEEPEPDADQEADSPDDPDESDDDAEDDGVDAEALAEVESELSELRERLEDVAGERDDLQEERDRLERRVEELESGGGTQDVDADKRSMGPSDALDQTDLLVRYGSKSEATLSDAHGDVDVGAGEVDANLSLETHTRFDADEVRVGDESYDSFVTGTLEYRFAAWVARTLLFEIRDTGNASELADLYDAIPQIDRVEFGGTVSMRDEAGDEIRESFDVVFRNQMGQPIAVGNLNDDRDPATGDMMADLLESSNAVAEREDSLAAAFSVTASFFEPAALETANEATNAGLLNRDARRSFVKTSRKRGYHLCLVEAHGDEFRLAVPDL